MSWLLIRTLEENRDLVVWCLVPLLLSALASWQPVEIYTSGMKEKTRSLFLCWKIPVFRVPPFPVFRVLPFPVVRVPPSLWLGSPSLWLGSLFSVVRVPLPCG